VELKQAEPNPTLSFVLELGLLLVILSALTLHGAVADVFWYPTALLVVIIFCASLLGWDLGLLPGPRMVGLEIFFILWLMLLIFSGLLSSHAWMSVYALERVIIALLFFYLMLWHFSGRQREKVLLWSLFGFPAIICIISIMFYLSKKPGRFPFLANQKCVQGTLVNHNNLAGLVILGFFLGLGLAMGLRRKEGEFRSELIARVAILAIPLAALLLGLGFSLSRSGWMAFVFSAAAFFVWLEFFSRRKILRNYLVLVLVIIFLATVLSVLLGKNLVKERAFSLSGFFRDPASGLTLTGREMIWKSTLGMIRDHPLLGIGPGNYWLEYPHYRSPGDFWGEHHAHNDFLQMTAEAGLGSSLLLVWLLAAAWQVWRRNYRQEMTRFQRRVSMGILLGMFGFLLQDQVDFHFYIPGLAYYFLALAAFLVRPRGER